MAPCPKTCPDNREVIGCHGCEYQDISFDIGKHYMIGLLLLAFRQRVVIQKLDYDPDWDNGTGYMDYAKKDMSMARDVVHYGQDPHGRVFILIPLEEQNFIIFERYSNMDKPLVSNGLMYLFPGPLTDLQLLSILFATTEHHDRDKVEEEYLSRNTMFLEDKKFYENCFKQPVIYDAKALVSAKLRVKGE